MHGAYGYRFDGIKGLDWLIADGVEDWPVLRIAYQEGEYVHQRSQMRPETAEITMPPVKANIVLDRPRAP